MPDSGGSRNFTIYGVPTLLFPLSLKHAHLQTPVVQPTPRQGDTPAPSWSTGTIPPAPFPKSNLVRAFRQVKHHGYKGYKHGGSFLPPPMRGLGAASVGEDAGSANTASSPSAPLWGSAAMATCSVPVSPCPLFGGGGDAWRCWPLAEGLPVSFPSGCDSGSAAVGPCVPAEEEVTFPTSPPAPDAIGGQVVWGSGREAKHACSQRVPKEVRGSRASPRWKEPVGICHCHPDFLGIRFPSVRAPAGTCAAQPPSGGHRSPKHPSDVSRGGGGGWI